MTQQSKLSEALAATLLRFKEIDRDTIESLCKRVADLEAAHSKAELSLEQMATWRSNDNSRERELNAGLTSIFSALNLRTLSTPHEAVLAIKETFIALGKAQDRRDAFAEAEKATGEAYIRLREILGAMNPGYGPSPDQVREFTEDSARNLVKSHNQLQWALRELLAQTRDVHDAGNEGETYQSDALEHAIAVADSLVGEQATEQYPVADEPLNRRIQELEVQLAEAKEPKGGNWHFSDNGLMEVGDASGNCRARLGALKIASSVEFKPVKDVVAEGDQRLMWSENALRKLVQDVMSNREAELAASFSETQAELDRLLSGTFKDAQRKLRTLPHDMDLKAIVTVTSGDSSLGALVKDIINTEMKPGGRIHKAMIGD